VTWTLIVYGEKNQEGKQGEDFITIRQEYVHIKKIHYFNFKS